MKLYAMLRRCLLSALLAGTACGTAPPDSGSEGAQSQITSPAPAPIPDTHTRSSRMRDPSTPRAAGSFSKGSSSGLITYHSGVIQTNVTNVYFIWYGNWSDYRVSATPGILIDLASNMGGTPYLDVVGTYPDRFGRRPPSFVSYAGSTTDWYSRGTSLGDTDQNPTLNGIVADAITQHRLPADPNGMYFIMTSPDVSMTQFCNPDCAWHRGAVLSGPWGSVVASVAWIGDAKWQCPTSCEEQPWVSPNGDGGADGMANMFAHELLETITDPFGQGWFTDTPTETEEVGDKCSFSFGPTYPAPGGGSANVHIGQRDYLLQQIWVNYGTGYCDMGVVLPPASLVTQDGLCLDVYGASGNAGAAVQTWTCNSQVNQTWLPTIEGPWRGFADKCLDVSASQTQNGAPIQEWDCNGSAAQGWSMGSYEVVGAQSGRCLDVTGMVNTSGTPTQLWDCLGYWNQVWSFTSQGALQNSWGKCLTIQNGNLADRTPVVISDCYGLPSQKWALRPGGEIMGQGSKCLTALDGGSANGTMLAIFTCGQIPSFPINQVWNLRAAVRGLASKCLDTTQGWSSSWAWAGERVDLWDCTYQANQGWTFSP